MGRTAEHDTVEDYHAISAHEVVRLCLAKSRAGGTIRWFQGQTGPVVAEMDYVLALDDRGGTMHLVSGVSQVLALEVSYPRYGGRRYWFGCPRCRRKVARLYQHPRGDLFLCRHCQRLTYTSCQRSGGYAAKLDRLWKAAGG